MESLALCGCACVTCLWMAISSFCVPRACTRLDEMKSMQFVCSRCSATEPHTHHGDSRDSCRILKPTPRAASQRGCFVPNTDKDRLVIQPKPVTPTPEPREQQWSCVNPPKGKTDPTQKKDDDPKTKETNKPGVDHRGCTNVVPQSEPRRACTVAPSKPPEPGQTCVSVPPPKPPRQGLDPKYPICETPKTTPKKDSTATSKTNPKKDSNATPKKDSKTTPKKDPKATSEKDSKGSTSRKDASRSDTNEVIVPPPIPARQASDPENRIVLTPTAPPEENSRDSIGRDDAERVDTQSPAEPDQRGGRVPDDPEMNESRRSRASEVGVGEPVRTVATRERENSVSVYEVNSDSDSDSVYESAQGSDSDSDSDSDSVYEMATESLVGDERAGPRRGVGTTTEMIGRGDVRRNESQVQQTPRNRWRKLSWPREKRTESGPQMQSRRSGTSKLRTSI